VARNANGIQRSVGLSFEGLDEAVEVDCEVVPDAFGEVLAWNFHKKRFYLNLVGGRGKNDSAFGLNQRKSTLVRSLMVSSMFQLSPG
jgi:hypothetical protein